MGDSSAVGFSFQGDVVNISSLTHLLTGRILKALCDGGVDIYAVASSIWLGTQFTTRPSLEMTVHAHLAAKKGVQGFLVKTLSIGWGHSVVAVEMSRTKAGTNALLLIGALATGCSYYSAAQILSRTMSSWGLGQDKIPNIDAVHALVGYVAPIVDDLGFARVLQLVTTSVKHQTAKLKHLCPLALTAHGNGEVLAAAIRQLIFTSQEDEKAYYVVKQRGAWLAAFASHILGMSVEVLLNDTIVWASGGSRGHATLQLGDQEDSLSSSWALSRPGLVLVDSPSGEKAQEPLRITYALDEALNAELGSYSELNDCLVAGIHAAIVTQSLYLYNVAVILVPLTKDGRCRINGGFQTMTSLKNVLSDLGVQTVHLSSPNRRLDPWPWPWIREGDTFEAGLSSLSLKAATDLLRLCPSPHNGEWWDDMCICFHIGQLIHGFAVAAIALVQCRYTAADIRLDSDLLSGRLGSLHEWYYSLGQPSPCLEWNDLFDYLGALLHGSEGSKNELDPAHTLGVSRSSHSIFYTAILDSNAYDEEGRVLTIARGRVSSDGVLRTLLVDRSPEPRGHTKPGIWPSAADMRVAPGGMIEPHYYPSGVSLDMTADITQSNITITTSIRCGEQQQGVNSLAYATHLFLSHSLIAPKCGHPRDRPYSNPQEIGVTGFNPFHKSLSPPLPDKQWIYALKGNKLEQVLQFSMVPSKEFDLFDIKLQYFSCIQCAETFQQGAKYSRSVLIMGG